MPRPAGRHRDDPAKAVTPTTRAAYLMTFFALAMIGLLALQLADIERQRRVAARQEGRVKALIAAAAPSAKRLQDAQPQLAAGLARADALVRRLRGQGAPSAIAAAGDLARSLQAAGAAEAINAAGDLARTLTHGDRVSSLLDEARALIAETRRHGTPADVEATRRTVAQLRRLGQETNTTLKASLDVQRQTLDLLRESVGIQREVLVHTRSLDRKFGGELPAR